MNKIKQFLDFELDFLSSRIPYIKINETDDKSNYFCIYQCFFKDDIKVYRVEPNCITVLVFNNNTINEILYEIEGKIKPIITVDQKTGQLYFMVKDNTECYNIYSCSDSLYPKSCKELGGKKKIKNYFTKLLVYNNNIILVYQDTLYIYKEHKSDAKKINYDKKIISSACNDEYIVSLLEDDSIIFLRIDSLNVECEDQLNEDFLQINPAHLYIDDKTINIYSIKDKFIIQKKKASGKEKWIKRGLDLNMYNLYAIQEINSNFIDKYMETDNHNNFEKSKKYINLISFVSEIYFPDNSYEGNVLFFGPSIYLPCKKNASNSLYSKLHRFKDFLFSNEQFFTYLDDYSKRGDFDTLESNIKRLLSDVKADDANLDKNEVDYLLNVIKLPEVVEEESIICSSLMPNFFCFIIAEITNSFLNILIIKVLEKESNDVLDETIKVYSSLYRLITSDLVKYKSDGKSKMKILNEKDRKVDDDDDDDDDDDGDDDDDDDFSANSDDCINSNLYILNSTFSPYSLRNQLWFLYKGKTTLSKLSNSDILKFNKICPEPLVEQRILDVAKAYLETDKFESCIEHLKKIDTDKENPGTIQNVYISHLLKQINIYENQFKLLQTLNKRLPKNMYKTLYIISLKANQFADAVDQFYSEEALSNLVREVKKSEELHKYKETIEEVLTNKNCSDIISLLKE